MAMTPRFFSASVSCSSVFSAPRSLNEAVNCRFSNFTQTSALAMRESVSLRRQGVCTTASPMRAAAYSTSSRVTGSFRHHAASRRSIQSRVRYQAPIMGRNHGSPL